MLTNSLVPKYARLQSIIRDDIIAGKYQNGDAIESENQMMKKYDVTRTTVRRAIDELVNEGLLRREQGKGTYVNFRSIKHNMWNFSGFTDYALSKSKAPVSKVLENVCIAKDGRQFLKLVRARGFLTGGDVFWQTIDTSLLPLDVFPGLERHDFSQASLYRVMKEAYHISPQTAELELHSIPSDEKIRAILNYQGDMPFLNVTGIVYSTERMEIERVDVVYNPNVKINIVANMM